jgi:DNA-binding protein HU-beta
MQVVPQRWLNVHRNPSHQTSQKGVYKMAAKKPAKAQATVTLRNLAAELAESHEVPKRQAEAMLSDMVGLIAKHLKKGNRLRLVGLGILQVRHRAARMGRNPAAGEAIKIKASKKVAFRAAKDLKEAV